MRSATENITSEQLARLIQQQNQLLDRQNSLLQQLVEHNRKNSSSNGGREVFIDNIDRDEMRSGFLVTSHRKKLWNAQLGLMNEFDRICKKHNLRWFIYAGTLLGAARHKGFIPWDDDVDVLMFRPDYEKLKLIIEDELKTQSKYHMWYWFNYRLESDTEAAQMVEPNLPLISREQENRYPGWAPLQPILRLIDATTTFIMPDARENVFYAAWLDIFAVDPCPPFSDERQMISFQTACELYLATIFPEQVRNALAAGQKFLIPRDKLLDFLARPYKQRAQTYEQFLLNNFTKTPFVAETKYVSGQYKKPKILKSRNFDEVVYLPFENLELPAPAGYDEVLTDFYGDWHKMVISHTHAWEYSVDVPYTEYFAKSALVKSPLPKFS